MAGAEHTSLRPVEAAGQLLERRAAELIASVRSRLAWRFATRALWMLGWGLGVLVLLLRLGFGVSTSRLLWALVLLGAAPVLGWVQARRPRFSTAEAAAWLDQGSGGAGYVVLGVERRGTPYGAAIEGQLNRAGQVPHLRRSRHLVPLLPALGFLALALWVPLLGKQDPAAVAVAERVEQRAEELAERLEALDEVVELDPDQRAELEARLERLAQEAERLDVEAAFEGLDRLEAELDRSAQQASEAAEQALESLAQGAEAGFSDFDAAEEALHQTLEQLAVGGLEAALPEETLAGLQALEAELAELAGMGGSGAGSAGAGGAQPSAGQPTPISPEMAARLAELAEAFASLDAELRQALAEALSKLDASGLEGAGTFDLSALRPIDEALARSLLAALERLDHSQCDHAPGGT